MSDERLVVPAAAAGERLDRFLAAPLGSRARAQRLIEAGQVLVDGAVPAKGVRLAGGETVAIDTVDRRAGLAGPAGADAPYSIAWEDERLLVVDKPAGVVVHPGSGVRSGTLVQALAGRTAGGEDPERPGIVHRLDRDTSGLLVVARDEDAHRALSTQLAAREIEREYVALVEGLPPSRTGTIDAPIGRDRTVRTRMSTSTDSPREAVTHFELDRALPADALLRVKLDTGRTHQIRVHFAAIGHPVAGDPEYGHAGRHGLERQFLHAARLAFDHPGTGERIEVSSPLPPDLGAALERASA